MVVGYKNQVAAVEHNKTAEPSDRKAKCQICEKIVGCSYLKEHIGRYYFKLF